MDESKQPGLRFSQIFLAGAHFEHREDALSLPPNTNLGEFKIKVDIQAGGAPDESKGVVQLAVETVNDSNPLYRFSATMVALIEQEPDVKNMSVKEYVTKAGASALFPFLREAVANLTGRGRFGPVWLKPINVSVLQVQAVEQAAPAQENAPGPK